MQKNEKYLKIGKKLKEARQELGEFDIAEVIKKMDIKKGALFRIERGETSQKSLNNYLLFLRSKGYDLNQIYDAILDE